MENVTTQPIQPVQPLPKNLPIQPVIIPEKPKTNFMLLASVIIACISFIGMTYYFFQTKSLSNKLAENVTETSESSPSTLSQNVTETSASSPQEISCKYKDSYSAGIEGFLDAHVVVKGDTLLSIAKNTLKDVSRADELARLNHDKYPNLSTKNPFLEVGWILNLPPEGVGRTNGLIHVETGRLSIGDNGWGTGYPQKSQRYDLEDLDKAMFGQNIKEGECVTIIYEGNDVSGSASGIRALKIANQ